MSESGDDPRRRRPGAERPAAGGGARAPRLHRRRGDFGPRGARARRRPIRSTSSLLDIVMPEMDGYEVCRHAAGRSRDALPAGGDDHGQRRTGEGRRLIEAGADDFIAKPFDHAELLARVGSLLRIKRYHDTIEAQAAELAAWNRQLEQRVQEQVDALERMGRLRRFLSPQLAEMVMSSGDESFLQEPPPRDHGRVLRPPRLHRVRGDGRARGPDAGAQRVPRGARRPRPSLRGHAGALRRRRVDGHLQRSAPVPGRARSAPCAWPSPCAGA